MADIQEAISRLSIVATTSGVNDAASQLGKLKDAQEGVAVASSSSERATLSLDKTFANIETRYNTAVKNQQAYQKIQAQVNQAVAQNPALQTRANEVLSAAAEKFGQVGAGARAYGTVVDLAGERVRELAAEAGPLGQVLTAIGPAGLAAAAGIGAIVAAIELMRDAANEQAQWARQIANTAETIGLSTTQLQALNNVAGTVGVTADQNAGALNKFAISLSELRDGTGSLFTQMEKLDPQLLAQLSVTRDVATAWDLLAQAYARADTQQRIVLSRSAFGRNGMSEGLVLGATARAGGIGGLADANQFDAISQQTIDQWKLLNNEINDATEAAKRNFTAIFATETLEAEKQFADGMLQISRWAKGFALSDDFHSFISFLANPTTLTVLQVLRDIEMMTNPATLPSAVTGLVGSIAGAGVRALGANSPSESGTSPIRVFIPTGGLNDPIGPSRPSGAAEAALRQQQISQLGAAATAEDRYNLSVAQTRKLLEDDPTAGWIATRVMANATLERATSLVNAHNQALGAAASVDDLVLSRALQLQKLQQQGAGLSAEQIRDQLDLTRAQALGTFAMQQQVDTMTVQTATYGMIVGAAAAYTAEQNRLNEAIRNHQVLTDQDRQKIHEWAQEVGAATQANKLAAANDNIRFGGQTALLSPEDVAIAQQLKGLYPDVATSLDSVQAAALRTQGALSTMASTVSNELTTDLTSIAMRQETIGQGASKMAQAVIQALEQMAIKIAVVMPLMRAFQMLVNSLGGWIMGGGSPSGYGTASSATAAVPSYDTGGYTGFGGVMEPAGIAHKGEIVWSQDDIARAGGVGVVEAMRLGMRGYADGGAVGANVVPYYRSANQNTFGSAAPVFNLNISAPEGTSVESASFASDGRGGGSFDVLLKRAVTGVMADDAGRNGPITRAILAKVGQYKS